MFKINKKSRASKVPFIKPNVNVMFQIDFKRDDSKPKDPETNIHRFGCNFMCCCAIPQFVNGKKLSAKDVLSIYYKSVQNNWISYDCSVSEPGAIMNYAASILGDIRHDYKNVFVKGVAPDKGDWNVSHFQHTSDLPGSSNIYFFIVDFLTGSAEPYGGHHFELFSAIGNLMYDPANCTVHKYKGVNKLSCYKVTLK